MDSCYPRGVKRSRLRQKLLDGPKAFQAHAVVRRWRAKEWPFAIDKAKHGLDRDRSRVKSRPEDIAHSFDLPGHVLGKMRAIPTANVEALVAVEEVAAILDSNQSDIVLGVNNEHTICSNDHVVNVASGARHAPVMKNGYPVNAGQNLAELSLAYRSTFPRSSGLLFPGDCQGDASNQVAQTSFNPCFSDGASPLIFTMGRRAG